MIFVFSQLEKKSLTSQKKWLPWFQLSVTCFPLGLSVSSSSFSVKRSSFLHNEGHNYWSLQISWLYLFTWKHRCSTVRTVCSGLFSTPGQWMKDWSPWKLPINLSISLDINREQLHHILAMLRLWVRIPLSDLPVDFVHRPKRESTEYTMLKGKVHVW